ncbi:MAG: hypothetical protein CSA26_05285 [Desulfobacterales bacterium]|nr:MAG: hypothetical protein CSA26_05285 [Desulfobacterales bacterium]
MDFKDEWNLDSAMKVLNHKTVDSRLWAEAVEWLILYGPADISTLLLKASEQAAGHCFPELKQVSFNEKGAPCYDLAQLARSLGISEEEAVAIVREKERRHKTNYFFEDDSFLTTH